MMLISLSRQYQALEEILSFLLNSSDFALIVVGLVLFFSFMDSNYVYLHI